MDLRETLSRKISIWIENNPGENLYTLAEKSSLSISTIRRIERMEVNPSLENTVQLLRVVGSEEEADAFLQARGEKAVSAPSKEFRTELRAKIRRWIDLHPSANLQMLSRLSGVSYSTLRRIEMRQVTASLEHTLQLLEVLGSIEEAKAFLRKHFADMIFLLRDPDDGERRRNVESKEEFLLLLLASMTGTLSLQDAQKRVGARAQPILEAMVKDQIMRKEMGVYSPVEEAGDVSDALRIKWMMDCADPRGREGFGPYAKFRAKGLNEDGIRSVHMILSRAAKEIDRVLEDPGNFGDELFGIGLGSTLLHPTEAATVD